MKTTFFISYGNLTAKHVFSHYSVICFLSDHFTSSVFMSQPLIMVLCPQKRTGRGHTPFLFCLAHTYTNTDTSNFYNRNRKPSYWTQRGNSRGYFPLWSVWECVSERHSSITLIPCYLPLFSHAFITLNVVLCCNTS